VDYFGLPGNRESLVQALEIGGNNISFVSYNEFGGLPAQETIQKIKDEKQKGQIVLVYAHWGDEYVSPPERVSALAHAFIDAGADMVIGSHPHVIQRSEVYKDKAIYYSLGNFIFDQYWDKEVSSGLVLELDVRGSDPSDWQIKEHPASIMRDGRTCLLK
jgi:poly-gamma-glutamate synthesis protein (capsule biosynthesis protein)